MNDAYWAASMDAAGTCRYRSSTASTRSTATTTCGRHRVPHNIGLGAASDPELIRRIARPRAARSSPPAWTGPSPRRWPWPATITGDGPTKATRRTRRRGRLRRAFVEGMQGDLGDDGIVACAKHWVGDGGTTHGIDQGETRSASRNSSAAHPPYRPALEAGVLT
jgi:beta-glucosidase